MLRKYYRQFIFICFIALMPYVSNAESLFIIYTANVNAALENCGCGDEPLGGIGKIKHISDSFKKNHSHVVMIDGGDFFNNYPYNVLNEAMLKAYQRLDYDYVVPGDQIFIDGDSFYQRVSSIMKDRVVISNTSNSQNNSLEAKYGPYNVSFAAILSPEAFDYIPKPKNLALLDPAHIEFKKQNNRSLNIVVYHGYLAEARQFAKENQAIDLLLIAHDEALGCWWEGNVCVVGNGKDSEHISIIEAKYDKSWKLDVEQKMILSEYPEAEDVLEIIHEFKENPGEED